MDYLPDDFCRLYQMTIKQYLKYATAQRLTLSAVRYALYILSVVRIENGKFNMLSGLIAITTSGMPAEHGRAFQRVADNKKCVIAVRAVGKYATGLLLENYATKGFHNKAKSCAWGPMAGFVLSDPRFTKNSNALSQRQALHNVIHSRGSTTPLYITDKRRKALESELQCMTLVRGDDRERRYKAQSPTGVSMHFILKHSTYAPGAHGEMLWAVFYSEKETSLSTVLKEPNNSFTRDHLVPVMAVVDPFCPTAVKHTYRAATTCDYDLWAVFPLRNIYSRSGQDRRMVPESDRIRQNLRSYIQYEDPHRGNITPRIAELRNALNMALCAEGYQGGEAVHHSDEAGRPQVFDIDFPCLFFIPHKNACYVNNTVDLRQLLSVLEFKYVLGLNPGWHRQLGLSVSMAGYYEI